MTPDLPNDGFVDRDDHLLAFTTSRTISRILVALWYMGNLTGMFGTPDRMREGSQPSPYSTRWSETRA